MNWHRLSRFFHLEGNLGGLRYDARFRFFELNPSGPLLVGNEALAAPEKHLDVRSHCDPATAAQLDVWESEGGAAIGTKR